MGYVRLFHKISVEFKTRIPTEQEFLIFFRHLWTENSIASLNMWTTYSMLNSTIKRKYGSSMKFFLRTTSLLKYYETYIKHKAEIFSTNVVQVFVNSKSPQGLIGWLGSILWWAETLYKSCLILRGLGASRISSSPHSVNILYLLQLTMVRQLNRW